MPLQRQRAMPMMRTLRYAMLIIDADAAAAYVDLRLSFTLISLPLCYAMPDADAAMLFAPRQRLCCCALFRRYAA